MYLYIIINEQDMNNLINEIKDSRLVKAIADFKITKIFFEEGELNICSYYSIPTDWVDAFEANLIMFK